MLRIFGLNIISNKEIKQIKEEAFVAGQIANSVGNAIVSAFAKIAESKKKTTRSKRK